MIRSALIAVFVLVAACGADGPPLTPSANLDVSVGTGGVETSARVGASNGIFAIGVGL